VDDRSRKLAELTMRLTLGLIAPGALENVTTAVEIAKELGKEIRDRRPRKQVERLIEDIADDLSEQFERVGGEFRNLGGDERDVAQECVVRVLASSGLDYVRLAGARFDGERIAAGLRDALSRELDQDSVDESGQSYAWLLLSVAAAQMCAIAKSAPESANKLALASYLSLESTSTRVTDALNRVFVPSFRRGTTEEHAEFTAVYLQALANQYGDLEQFGLSDVPEALRWQPVDSTYVSLVSTEVLSPQDLAEIAHAGRGAAGELRSLTGQPIERAISEAAVGNAAVRLIVSGLAGSGKTTLLRWIAVKVAMSAHNPSALPDELRSLAGRIPFLVNLRTAFTAGAETSSGLSLLTRDIQTLADPPGDWAASVRDQGRALILVDGLDELPPDRRASAIDWLAAMLNGPSVAPLVLTSRPEAIDALRLSKLGFSAVQLQTLRPEQLQRIVTSWFDAIISGSPRHAQHYARRRNELLRDLGTNISLRQLADTPLMAAMLCAYYADGASAAPLGRVELVSKVTDVLLDKRERSRGLIPVEFRALGTRKKQEALSHIAYEMFVRGASSVRLVQALGDSENTAPSDETSHTVALDEPLTAYLVERSVIFTQVAHEDGQFVHRLFLEYLAAVRYLNSGDVNDLMSRFGQPGWYNVVAFFCAIAPGWAANDVVGKCFRLRTQLGENDDERNTSADPELRRLTFCIAECIGVGSSIESNYLSALQGLLEESLPAQTAEESTLVATVGAPILESFRQPNDTDEVLSFIHTARQIGGRPAIELLADYAERFSEPAVRDELLSAWEDFEVELYADLVLRRLDLVGVSIPIHSEAACAALMGLDDVTKVSIRSVAGFVDLQPLAALNLLTHVDLLGADRLTSLEGAQSLPNLTELTLFDDLGILRRGQSRDAQTLSLAPLAECRLLTSISLSGTPITNLTQLSDLPQLNCLEVGLPETDLATVFERGFTALRRLTLAEASLGDLDFLGTLANLERLRAIRCNPASSTRRLRDMAGLRELAIAVAANVPLQLPDSGSLESLFVDGLIFASALHTADADTGRQVGLTSQPNLAHLTFVNGVLNLQDLRSLAGLATLRSLIILKAGSVDSLEGIHRLTELRQLEVSGSRITALSKRHPGSGTAAGEDWSIAACTKLEAVILRESRYLEDLTGLSELPRLKKLIIETSAGPEVERFAKARPDVEIDFLSTHFSRYGD